MAISPDEQIVIRWKGEFLVRRPVCTPASKKDAVIPGERREVRDPFRNLYR